MSLSQLQQALPMWVRIERHLGQPVVTEKTEGNVHVTEVYGYPEAPKDAVRADVHFVVVAPTEGFPEKEEFLRVVRSAFGEGEFQTMTADDLAGGPSYITLGGWLGSQDLALMLIGAVELAGIADAITPEKLGVTDRDSADMMAGNGFVMLGPSKEWAEVPTT